MTSPQTSAAPTADPVATVKRGATWLVGCQLLKLFLQIGSTAILARLLAPSDFGLISLVTPIVAFFTVFRDIGLTSATIYTKDISPTELTSLFWINAGAGLLLATLLMLVAPAISAFYGEPRLTGMLAAMASVFIFNGIAAQYQALMQRTFRFKALTAIDAGANLIGTLAGVVAAFHGFGYWSLTLAPIVTQIAVLLITLPLSHWHPGKPCWQPRTGAMARFGSHVTGFNVLNYFSRNLDNLLIGKVWGMEALGYYGRAYTLMMTPLSQLIYPLTQAVVPVLTRINHDAELYRRTFQRITQLIMFATAPLVAGLIVSRGWVIDILLGDKWQQVAPIFLLLGLASFVQPINNAVGWLMISQGRSREVLVWGFISSALMVLFIVAGLPFGTLAVAASYSIGQLFLLTPLLWWYAGRNGMVQVRDLWPLTLPYWGAAAVSGLSFELVLNALLDASRITLPPLAGVIAAFTWVFGIQVGLFALHPAGRRILVTVLSAIRLRSITGATKP